MCKNEKYLLQITRIAFIPQVIQRTKSIILFLSIYLSNFYFFINLIKLFLYAGIVLDKFWLWSTLNQDQNLYVITLHRAISYVLHLILIFLRIQPLKWLIWSDRWFDSFHFFICYILSTHSKMVKLPNRVDALITQW